MSKKLSSTEKLFAKFVGAAYDSYKGLEPATVGSFTLNKSLSDERDIKRYVIYETGKDLVFACRGTIPTVVGDIYLDKKIYLNTLDKTDGFIELNRRLKSIINSTGKNVYLTGHSLGGALAFQLLKDNIDNIKKCYGFSMGIAQRQASSLKAESAMCNSILSFVKSKKDCELRKKIESKLVIITASNDPISILSRFSGFKNVIHVKSQGMNPHSLSNFTGAGFKGGVFKLDQFQMFANGANNHEVNQRGSGLIGDFAKVNRIGKKGKSLFQTIQAMDNNSYKTLTMTKKFMKKSNRMGLT